MVASTSRNQLHKCLNDIALPATKQDISSESPIFEELGENRGF
jgi:hypothetical protein